jgi:hypothetical protein
VSGPFAFLKSRLGFLVWGWATLLVVLVSAAPDGGAPGSREIGSAFDPATPSVAVGPQQPRVIEAIEAHEALPPAAAAGDAAQLLPTRLAATGSVAGNSPIALSPYTAGDPRSLNRAHGARAPPLA